MVARQITYMDVAYLHLYLIWTRFVTFMHGLSSLCMFVLTFVHMLMSISQPWGQGWHCKCIRSARAMGYDAAWPNVAPLNVALVEIRLAMCACSKTSVCSLFVSCYGCFSLPSAVVSSAPSLCIACAPQAASLRGRTFLCAARPSFQTRLYAMPRRHAATMLFAALATSTLSAGDRRCGAPTSTLRMRM